MNTGFFITFEGVEGSGKSTQARLLAGALTRAGREVVCTREPGGTPIGDRIRSVLLDPENRDMISRVELMLYAASRAQNVEEIIRPALDDDKVVVCDRFADSTVAYQGCGLEIDTELIRTLNSIAIAGVIPNLTFVVDIEPAEGARRKFPQGTKLGADRIELRDDHFHRRVREGFLEIARAEPQRVIVVDGARSVEAIHEAIWQHAEIQALVTRA